MLTTVLISPLAAASEAGAAALDAGGVAAILDGGAPAAATGFTLPLLAEEDAAAGDSPFPVRTSSSSTSRRTGDLDGRPDFAGDLAAGTFVAPAALRADGAGDVDLRDDGGIIFLLEHGEQHDCFFFRTS